jgi:hypothetical protein
VAVVLAAESHHADILPLLQRDGVDVPGAVESQRYISLDVADSLPALVAGGSRDGVRSASGEYSHLLDAVEAEAKKHIKVAVG